LLVVFVFSNAPREVSAQPGDRRGGPVIGVAVPLSGDYAPLGEQVLEAVELAASEAGVRVVSADTEGKPVGAMKAVQSLAARDDVVAVIGPLGQRESQAAAGAAQRADIPLFTFSNSEGVNRAGPWVFRVRSSPAETAASLARVARERLELRTVGIVFPENVYGRSAAVAFARAFEQAGGRVTAVGSYPEDVTDFRKPLGTLVGTRVHIGQRARYDGKRADSQGYARVRSSPQIDFEAMFIPDYHGRVARLLPFLSVANIQTGEGGDGEPVQLLGMPGWQGESMRMTGAHAAGAIYPDVFAGPAEGGKAGAFARMFEEKTGRQPVNLDAEAFDVAWMVASVGKDVWRTTAESDSERRPASRRQLLRQKLLRRQPVAGAAGSLEFGPAGEPRRALELFEFDVDGEVAPWN
jgi:ABC-type branched-subunit amino acid transport system substrate-binding protein